VAGSFAALGAVYVSAAEQLQADPFILRSGRTTDAPLLFSSWLKSYWHATRSRQLVQGPIFFAEHHRLIERLIPLSAVVCACNPEDSDQVFGWAMGDPGKVLHYVYLREPYRHFGIAHRMLDVLRIENCAYSHRTPAFERIARERHLTFNPYLTGVAP
jgi:GNAT superfamily N-acetyltransferase